MKNSRNIATIILLIVTVGFLLTLPFSNTFAGRLLGSLFGASMIGGFADWFGVKALTRKPLGIPYRTEIIPRNREKLFESLVSMVDEELLTRDSVIGKLDHFSISKSLIAYLEEDGGKEDLSHLAGKIAEDMLSGADMEESGEYLRKLLADNTSDIRLVPIVSGAVEWLSANIMDKRLLDAAIEELKGFIHSARLSLLLNNTLKDLSDSISRNVQKESTGRKLFFRLVLTVADYGGITPSKLSPRLITEITQYLEALKDPQSSQRKSFERWLERASNDLLVNEATQGKIEQKGRKLLERKGSGAFLAEYIYPLIKDSGQLQKSGAYIEGIINKLAEGLKNDPAQQKALDHYIKIALTRLLENNSKVIGQLVRQKLDNCTAEMLADLVEERAGNDLQIIRINGSIVGGLAGVIIFLLTFWL
ncbi:MAG: DUF445 domain-containing protein [Eubacteriales bacterium]|nr:DUF445 domain-containing protein [Ruminiclostridium sp.]MDD4422855.1 DUF445 domain-containing protein [Eubacteriales bacterium]